MLLENVARNLIDSVGHGRMVEVKYRTAEHFASHVVHTASSLDQLESRTAFEVTVTMSCGCVARCTEIGLSIPSQWHNQPNDERSMLFGDIERLGCTHAVNMTLFDEEQS